MLKGSFEKSYWTVLLLVGSESGDRFDGYIEYAVLWSNGTDPTVPLFTMSPLLISTLSRSSISSKLLTEEGAEIITWLLMYRVVDCYLPIKERAMHMINVIKAQNRPTM